MKNSRSSSSIPSGSSLGNVALGIGVLALGWFAVTATQDRIDQLHAELFNAKAPLEYDVDFENIQIVARARVTSLPRDNSKWKDFPLMSQSQVYRVTHRLGIGSHTGSIELKTADNGQGSEFLNSDIVVNFEAQSGSVSVDIPSFKYDTPDFRIQAENISGFISWSGPVRMKAKTLDLKMVNYEFKLADVGIEIPNDQKSINVLTSKITLDEATLGHSKMTFTGINPIDIQMSSTFNSQPVEVHWNVQKAVIKDQDVKINSGKISFPVALLDAFVMPKVERTLKAAESDAKSNNNEKIRFLFSAAKEVSLAEAKATALRQIALTKNIKREGDFYTINVEKQDAFSAMEEKVRKASEKNDYLESWKSLPTEKMYEEAFYGVVFGDHNRATAARELLAMKLKDDNGNPLYQALKARLILRDAGIDNDTNTGLEFEKAADIVKDIALKIPDHKLTTFLKLDLARARDDKKEAYRLFEEFKTRELEPQILATMEFLKYLHTDNNKALELLEKAHALNPASLYAQNTNRNRIHVYKHLDDKLKMNQEFKVLIENGKASPADFVLYSGLLKDSNDMSGAMNTIEQCFVLDALNKSCNDQKESLMTQIALGKQKENPDIAIEYMQNLHVDRPASTQVNSGLGFLYKLKGDFEKSITHFSLACALGDSFSCNEAGDALSGRNDTDRATLLYDVSCDLQSGNGCMKAGLQVEKIGELERSGNYFDRGCNQLNDNVACYHLARNFQVKRKPNQEIVPYLNKACKLYSSACKLANVYRTSNKQPAIPAEPQ
ncbi:MAG: hypothetical protein V4598_17470 [Bdellovibrionota bacterium]